MPNDIARAFAERGRVPANAPKPPTHLRKASAAWWGSVVANYELEPHHLKLLTLAAEAWDRNTQAREALRKQGLTFEDRFHQPKARPEIAIERDSRIGFASMLKALDLDIEPPTNGRRY